MIKKILLIALVILFFVTLNNCNSGTELQDELQAIENGENNGPESTGRLKLTLSSNSGNGSSLSGILANNKEDILNLFITINGLEVHKTSGSDAGWHSLPIADGTYDLMALDNTGWGALISSSEITPGVYNQLRFMVTSAEVTTESGTYDVEIPSGKIKINLAFTISEDMVIEITMTIDPKNSLKVTGNEKNPKYKLNPNFKISNVTEECDEDCDDDDDDDDEEEDEDDEEEDEEEDED